MIRFNCPGCGQLREVFPALAHLPILCKGCGKSIVVPSERDSLPAPPPPPIAETRAADPPRTQPQQGTDAPRSPAPARPKPAASPNPSAQGDDDDERDLPFLMAESDGSPNVDFDMPGPTAAHQSDAHRARMSGALISAPTPPVELPLPLAKLEPSVPAAPPAPPRARAAKPFQMVLTIMVDVAVGLLLLVAGAFVGTLLSGKTTREVWSATVSFPSIELLMWLAAPLVLTLIYLLIISRGKSLGGWLKRKAG